ncbi:thiamine phosphate synthase [Fictibacillus arsenicus]|uniref:Thiamine-phosphate synthase n=1 Tax=Fictibacillus arsenicus TaxID=255247 RepID=A0A1V3G7F7_9BACL|nr:thiamine phosphate synthase [Fictibacillus arsenicus]OOE12333.1 thiamine-phosphate diphosphorylase [Fictibacillus arsenicus]
MTTLSQVNLAHKLSLYFVAGTMNCQSPEIFREILLQAVKGGITAFQYREKGVNSLIGEKRLESAMTAKEICRDNGILFIVNDDLELMKAVDADGLHVGQTDGSLDFIRKETEGKILGVSAHTLAEAKDAVSHGADYIGTGPIYATVTKPDAKEPVGKGIFQEFRTNGITVPVVGIGGISLENAATVIRAGADGAAIISAISQSEDPRKTTRELLLDILNAKRGL